eukprot:4087842-Amphidinium_carterae.1
MLGALLGARPASGEPIAAAAPGAPTCYTCLVIEAKRHGDSSWPMKGEMKIYRKALRKLHDMLLEVCLSEAPMPKCFAGTFQRQPYDSTMVSLIGALQGTVPLLIAYECGNILQAISLQVEIARQEGRLSATLHDGGYLEGD